MPRESDPSPEWSQRMARCYASPAGKSINCWRRGPAPPKLNEWRRGWESEPSLALILLNLLKIDPQKPHESPCLGFHRTRIVHGNSRGMSG